MNLLHHDEQHQPDPPIDDVHRECVNEYLIEGKHVGNERDWQGKQNIREQAIGTTDDDMLDTAFAITDGRYQVIGGIPQSNQQHRV